jgi:hypothetical protein
MTLAELIIVANLSTSLIQTSAEQALALVEAAIEKGTDLSEPAKDGLGALVKSTRATKGFSWWLRLDYDVVDPCGGTTKQHSIKMYDGPNSKGQPTAGLFGGKSGNGQPSGQQLQSFQDKEINKLLSQ